MAEDTRDKLLRAAWVCVRDGGIGAATSRAIVAEADVNLGAITYYFGSKDRLLAEAYVAAIRGLIEPALRVLGEEGADPVARMLAAVAQLQLSFSESPDDIPAYLEVLVQSHRIPLLNETVAGLFSDLRAVLSSQMAEQQESRGLPDWVEPEAMAGLLLAVAQGVVLQTTVDPGGPGQAPMAGQFTRLLIAGR